MSIRISVIIPCFNQGHFIADALGSIPSFSTGEIEIIIVNDGSTDHETIRLLNNISGNNIRIITQANAGLAGARNAGLLVARGEFILPLDADNRVREIYFSEAVRIMDANPDIGVVYGDAEYFGSKSGRWVQGEFNLQKLMISNFIDACALIRRSVLEEVGFYDGNMKFMGWEDWDRWLAISFRGWKFHYLGEVAFDYRVEDGSMIKKLYNQYERPNYLEQYIHKKYPDAMGHQFIIKYFTTRFKKNPFLFLVKLIILTYFPGYHSKLLKKNKIRNGI